MKSKAPAKMRGVTVVFDEDGGISMVLIPDRRVMVSRRGLSRWVACVTDECGNPDHGYLEAIFLEDILASIADLPIRAEVKTESTPI